MAVFDAQTKVSRAFSDPMTDRKLPVAGALNYRAVTSPSALAGTVGTDCRLVHGDAWQQVVGNMTENITADVKTTILQNQTHTVLSNRIETITGNHTGTTVGKSTETRVGAHVHTNIAPRANTFISPRVDQFASTSQHHEPTSYIRVIQKKIHWENFSYKSGIVKLDAFGATFGLYATIKLDAAPLKVDVNKIATKFGEHLIEAHISAHDIRLFASKTIATASLLGVLWLGTPTQPNALPTPTIITPLE